MAELEQGTIIKLLNGKHVPLTVSSAEVDKVLCILLIIVEETLLSNGIQEIIAIASITT